MWFNFVSPTARQPITHREQHSWSGTSYCAAGHQSQPSAWHTNDIRRCHWQRSCRSAGSPALQFALPWTAACLLQDLFPCAPRYLQQLRSQVSKTQKNVGFLSLCDFSHPNELSQCINGIVGYSNMRWPVCSLSCHTQWYDRYLHTSANAGPLEEADPALPPFQQIPSELSQLGALTGANLLELPFAWFVKMLESSCQIGTYTLPTAKPSTKDTWVSRIPSTRDASVNSAQECMMQMSLVSLQDVQSVSSPAHWSRPSLSPSSRTEGP